MDAKTKKILIERFNEAPADIRDLLASEELAELTSSIARTQHLNEAQGEALLSEVRLVLLGIEDIESLTENIVDALTLDHERAAGVVLSVDEIIFSLVRDSLNVLHGYKEKVPGVSSTPTPNLSEQREAMPSPPKSAASDPVAASILGDNRRPGAQPDPYREPIDEE